MATKIEITIDFDAHPCVTARLYDTATGELIRKWHPVKSKFKIYFADGGRLETDTPKEWPESYGLDKWGGYPKQEEEQG